MFEKFKKHAKTTRFEQIRGSFKCKEMRQSLKFKS